MKPIIEVKGLSKEYQRGAQKEQYLSLREQVFKSFKPGKKKDKFWALKDINFDVYPGDSLAIIGKNGAGKSTLLKILSKITPPTKGEIILRGRLASLLEVGTGFHPELTGRENIYLNGSILGLGRAEINRQFDAIVDFSGVETFLDTPLKHYSSGMKLRLAFSVAAHLEPEILVIDEVLAVGDSAFQQKCLDKMTEVSLGGRTLLFVSHNLQAVRNLCQRAILLENGEIVQEGNVDNTINAYISQNTNSGKRISLKEHKNRRGKQKLIFNELLFSQDGYEPGEVIKLSLTLESLEHGDFTDLDFGIAIQDTFKNNIIHLSNRFLDKMCSHSGDNTTYAFSFDCNLRPGRYFLVLFLRSNDEIQDWINDAATLDIKEGNVYGYSNSDSIQGLIQPEFNFSLE
jgi:lipopolysaccharide transport system ATP-binding protein